MELGLEKKKSSLSIIHEHALKQLTALHLSHDYMHCISFKRKINTKTVIANFFFSFPLRVFAMNFY